MALLYMNKYLSQFGRIKEESTLWFDAKASNRNLLSSLGKALCFQIFLLQKRKKYFPSHSQRRLL